MSKVITLVLGGGRGTRLFPLTKYRSKPAVPLAGKYRLIDIPLSNCINSGFLHIYVLTQFMSVSLHRHIRGTYQFDRFSDGFVEILAAQQTMDDGTDWYQGTADAVRKNRRYLEGCEYVLILSGDQLYQMDYRQLLATHQQSGADVTIAALPVRREAAHAFGIMKMDERGKVTGFLEKPKTAEELNMMKMDPAWLKAHGIHDPSRNCLASMGIYLFNRETLVNALDKTNYADFGREIFPAAIRSRHVQVHLFDAYWEDIGTIRSFYDANLALASSNPPLRLASAEAPIYTRARFLAPSQFEGAAIHGSLIAEGCRIQRGAVIENSVIGLRCHIGEGSCIRDSIIMGADMYESEHEQAVHLQKGEPPLAIGRDCVIEGAIIDKNCRIGDGVRVENRRGIVDSEDSDQCVIRDGIPVVLKNAILPKGWQLDS